jgi:glycine/D-amino acid oxidase-like deaminating enzyme
LWAALLSKELYPERSVVLLEGRRVGWAASGRNGGFCDASLTHGAVNGRERFPAEFAALQRLGAENLDAIEAALARHGIDCDFERTGTIAVATEEYQVRGLPLRPRHPRRLRPAARDLREAGRALLRHVPAV